MKSKLVTICTIIVVGCMLWNGSAYAQVLDASKLWIRAYGTTTANMLYGNRIGNNTTGIDSSTTIPLEYREQETPPPPLGFEAIWAPVRSNQFGVGVRGLLDHQFNGSVSATQVDTFRINFSQADNPDQDISFKWASGAQLLLRCDSAALIYFDPVAGANARVEMLTVDTLVIPAAGTNGVSFLRIFKYGAKLVDTYVKQESPLVPDAFTLHQNYPNPFNPTTNITFDIQKISSTDVTVYNVLGQKIATLVTSVLTPGVYSTQWNGTTDNGAPVSSGVYFVRLNARVEGSAQTFTALRKLLLMK